MSSDEHERDGDEVVDGRDVVGGREGDDDREGVESTDRVEEDGERTRNTSGEAVARETAAGDGETVYAAGREGDDSWLGEGLAWVLIAAGVVLVVVPEPATSATGLLLIVAGIAVWIAAEAR